MKTFNYLIILFVFISLIGCNKESDSDARTESKIIDLKENFSADEFKEAIIGKWQSVFEHAGKENVIYLELNDKNEAKITLKKDNASNNYQGDYIVDFSRQPMEDYLTLGEITISTQNKIIKLSRVNFGLHSAVHGDSMYLRIDESPYGVLDRIK
jgi:hypothetical protein